MINQQDLESVPAKEKEPYAYPMTAKFEGRCTECEMKINKGDRIYYNPRMKEAFCEGCGKEINN